MLFTSIEFVFLFLPLTLAGYYAAKYPNGFAPNTRANLSQMPELIVATDEM